MVAVLVIGFLFRLLREKDKAKRGKMLANTALFVTFIGLTIAAACVTIRVEMRWIYISLASSLLFMAYLYGALAGEKGTAGYLKRILPGGWYWRAMWP